MTELGENNMELVLKVDLQTTKEEMSADFWEAHSSNWNNPEEPTHLEIQNSIKDEINSWLDDLQISFKLEDTGKL